MAGENRLARNIKMLIGGQKMSLYQGKVTSVSGSTCSVDFGGLEISDIRLRATITEIDRQMVIVPKVGSYVIVGSLDLDYTNMVVLQIDEAEQVIFNGGKLGGLIKIEDLTAKLNNLVDELNRMKEVFNNHIHTVSTSGTAVAQSGVTAKTTIQASSATKFKRGDYEDDKVKH